MSSTQITNPFDSLISQAEGLRSTLDAHLTTLPDYNPSTPTYWLPSPSDGRNVQVSRNYYKASKRLDNGLEAAREFKAATDSKISDYNNHSATYSTVLQEAGVTQSTTASILQSIAYATGTVGGGSYLDTYRTYIPPKGGPTCKFLRGYMKTDLQDWCKNRDDVHRILSDGKAQIEGLMRADNLL